MRKSIVKQAKTKDEAIKLALNEIGKSRADVDIEIIEEGSSGFLGIGSKDAVVRISYDEALNDSLFDFESEIKRGSFENDDYNIHERSKYFEDEADANYISEASNEETDFGLNEEIERETSDFNQNLEAIRSEKEDLGNYERLQKINAYEQNSSRVYENSEDLTKTLDENIGKIEDDLRNYKNPRREYEFEEEKPQSPYEFDLNNQNNENFSDDLEVEREILTSPSSKITFTSSNEAPVTERKVDDPVSYESYKNGDQVESPDASDFKVKSSSTIAQDKQKTDIDKYYKAKEFLEEILKAMHFEDAIVYGNLEGSTISLDAKVDENDTGIAIGKGGATLDAIEMIIRKSIDSRSNNLRVNVDINNYKKRRDEKIRELAADTARKVQRSKKAWNLKYMNSYERRLAHEEISKFPNVRSHSEGQEPKRYVVVSYVGEDE